MKTYSIHEDIRKAETLPAAFYRSEAAFETSKEKIFASTWQYIADANQVAEPGQYHPFTLLEGVLDEPLLLSRDKKGALHCLSNVCTHRGKIIAEAPGKGHLLTCGYHGRCFGLDGRFRAMPEFEQAENFPRPSDHLASIPLQSWHG